MANKFDKIQKKSQELSDAADAVAETAASGENDNAPVAATVATESAVGGDRKSVV